MPSRLLAAFWLRRTDQQQGYRADEQGTDHARYAHVTEVMTNL
jgi:hypothetical protein